MRLFPPASPAAKNKSIIGLLLKLYTINQGGLDGTNEPDRPDGPDGQSYRIPAVVKTICDKNARAWVSTISNLNEWFNL